MKPYWLWLAVPAVVMAFPFTPVSNPFFLQIGIIIFIHVLMGQAWNLFSGYTGYISFGHAMFFGLGAFATMILVVDYGFDPYVSLWCGAGLAFLFALPLSVVLFRLHGPYFALGTLAFAEIVRLAAINWKSLTHGGEGILLISVPPTVIGGLDVSLGSKMSYFYLSFGLACLATALMAALTRSKMGYFLMAIRENEEAVAALGIHPFRHKLLAFSLSASLAGLAGGLMAMVIGIAEPGHLFSVHFSSEMIFMTVVGGIGTVLGPVVGALVLVLLSELLKEYVGTSYLMVYGLILMLVILYMPEGMYGYLRRKWREWRWTQKGRGDAGVESGTAQ